MFDPFRVEDSLETGVRGLHPRLFRFVPFGDGESRVSRSRNEMRQVRHGWSPKGTNVNSPRRSLGMRKTKNINPEGVELTT